MSALLATLAVGFALIWAVAGLATAANALLGWTLGILLVLAVTYVWGRA